MLENSSVQSHVSILQGIIARMASNSANCKTWAITVCAGLVIVLIDKTKINYIPWTMIPITLFWVLDCYYLSLERIFRTQYSIFVNKLHKKELQETDIFQIKMEESTKEKIKQFAKGFWSFSTSPFYLILNGIALLCYFAIK
jgi:hypothetical protein